MIFSKDQESEKMMATTLIDGRSTVYECKITACKHPVCMCQDVYLDLVPVPDKNQNQGPAGRHQLRIDIDQKELVSDDNFKMSAEDSDFGRSFLSLLDEDDMLFLMREHWMYKHVITESTSADAIEAVFDYDKVETDGLMSAYNNVLPYGEVLYVTSGDKRYMIIDSYCLLPKCPCTDATMNVLPFGGDKKDDKKELCTVSVNYRKKQWEELEDTSSVLSLQTLERIITEQIPDFYQKLSARHSRLKAIYACCKKRHGMSKQPMVTPKVGRNDPCPCGSGKKFKKCCLGKAR